MLHLLRSEVNSAICRLNGVACIMISYYIVRLEGPCAFVLRLDDFPTHALHARLFNIRAPTGACVCVRASASASVRPCVGPCACMSVRPSAYPSVCLFVPSCVCKSSRAPCVCGFGTNSSSCRKTAVCRSCNRDGQVFSGMYSFVARRGLIIIIYTAPRVIICTYVIVCMLLNMYVCLLFACYIYIYIYVPRGCPTAGRLFNRSTGCSTGWPCHARNSAITFSAQNLEDL